MTVYAAYLRVYEPIGSFEPALAERWQAAIAAGTLPDRAAVAAAEHQVSLHRMFSKVRAADVEDPVALAITDDGVTYVCPLDLPLRRFAALTDFRDGLPAPVASAFVQQGVADRTAAEYAAWLGARPTPAAPHVQTARWQVPLRWFVAFEPAERQLALGERMERHSSGGGETEVTAAGVGRRLGYVTAMSRARRRVARALSVLRRTLEDGPIVEGIEDLGRWLEEFHPHALVELDYGGLVHLLDDDTLEADTSAADVAAAVNALRGGDPAATAAAYERVVSRWHRLALIESAS